MKQRINSVEKVMEAMKPLFGINAYLSKSTVEKSLLYLIYFRVSQINGCAYCLDMHSKDLRANGEAEQRLYMIAAWRHTDLYTKRERAALAYAEALTRLPNNELPDEVWEEAMNQFSEDEMIALTMGVIGINSYNRINIAFRTPAGNYVPGQHAVSAE